MPRKGVVPPQFLKNPPRSWKRDLSKIHAEARRDIKKSAGHIGSVRMSEKGSRRKSRKRAIHILPDSIALTAALVPLISSAPGTATPLSSLTGENPLSWLPGSMYWSLRANWKKMLELGIMAIGIKKGAQYLGLNKIGTKELKIA